MRATRGQHVVAPGKGQASFLGRRLTRVAGQPSTSARRGSAVRSKPDDVELCREKIDLSKRQLSEELLRDGGANLDGVECYDVTFVGADARVTVRCPKESYILDAGEAAGLELPSSCRGGICGACVGKVTRGSADQSDVSFISLTLHPYIAASPPGVEGTGPRRLCARPLTTSRSPNTVPTRRSPTCRSLWRTIRLRRA